MMNDILKIKIYNLVFKIEYSKEKILDITINKDEKYDTYDIGKHIIYDFNKMNFNCQDFNRFYIKKEESMLSQDKSKLDNQYYNVLDDLDKTLSKNIFGKIIYLTNKNIILMNKRCDVCSCILLYESKNGICDNDYCQSMKTNITIYDSKDKAYFSAILNSLIISSLKSKFAMEKHKDDISKLGMDIKKIINEFDKNHIQKKITYYLEKIEEIDDSDFNLKIPSCDIIKVHKNISKRELIFMENDNE